MNVREKLVELQVKADIEDETSENTTQHREYTADLMIANGVTVKGEIDAKTFQLMRECERLKEENESLANAVNVLEEINSDLYKQIKGVTVQEWISVKDRLPEVETPVIVYGGNGITIDWLKDYGKHGFRWGNLCCGSYNPKYWHPMPQPPKGE